MKKHLLAITIFCITEIIATYMTSLSYTLNIPIQIVILNMFLYVFIAIKYDDKKKEFKIQLKELQDASMDLDIQLKAMSDKTAVLEGDKFFYFALSQSPSEPMKYSLLEKCVNDYNHPLAAIFLGIIYRYGVFQDGKRIIEKNIEKTSKLYHTYCKYDTSGFIDWNLGFYYQNNLIERSKAMDESMRSKTAYDYYVRSVDKGFPKGYNSIGTCYLYGIGVAQDINEAHYFYKKGKDLGDVYAAINCGSLYLKESEDLRLDESRRINALKQAVDCFSVAKNQKNTGASMRLAMVYDTHSDIFGVTPKEIANCYLKEIHIDNQYSAVSYYRLGDLLQKNTELQADEDILNKLHHDTISDPVVVCYINSYNIYLNLIKNDVAIAKDYKIYYDKLLDKFKNQI